MSPSELVVVPATEQEERDQRTWTAWVAKGKAHDRLVHRRMRMAAAVVALGATCAVVLRVLVS